MNSKSNNLTRTNTAGYIPRISKDTPVQFVKGVGPARATLLKRLGIETLEEWSHILFDQALLAEGGSLVDPASFVKRLNAFLLEAVK